jgi:Predicted transcriptional regulators
MDADEGVMAAILVASEHSSEDTSHSYEIIGDESKTKVIGHKMKEYRLSHGLSQEQLAKQLGISRPYMSEIESNKRSMSVKTIKNFTDKLGITLSDFFS